MEDGGKGPLPHFLLERPRDVFVGGAGVDDERQTGDARRLDVAAEAGHLIVARRGVVVVIEPGFADGNDARVLCQAHDIVERHVGFLACLMRMCADRAPDAIVGLDDLPQLLEAAHARRDRHHRADAGRRGALDERRAIRLEVREVEMAVAVDEHHVASAST